MGTGSPRSGCQCHWDFDEGGLSSWFTNSCFLTVIIFFNFLNFIFIHQCLFPVIPSSTSKPPIITTLLSLFLSSFSFLFFTQSLHPPSTSHTLWAVSLLSIYESVSVLLVSSVCSLGSTWAKYGTIVWSIVPYTKRSGVWFSLRSYMFLFLKNTNSIIEAPP